MSDSSGHHLVYGTLSDYLTGEKLRDTDDERLRQQLEVFFIEEKGYRKEELEPRLYIETNINNQAVRSTIELTIRILNKRTMIVRYAPGSLVTRERAALSAARILDHNYQIPLTVVTNSREAELLDTYSGKILTTGLKNIPDRLKLIKMATNLEYSPLISTSQREKEARILNVFDIDVCCHGTKKCITP